MNGEHTEPALLYLGMAGESGTRKSKALKYFMTPLRNWLRENCGESIRDDVTPEGLVSLMARQNGRGILYADEASIIDVLTGAMYSSKGSRPNLNVFLNAYDGSPVLVERSTMDCPEIPEAFLTITIGLQPGV